MADKEYFTPDEVAEKLSIGVDVVYKLLRSGELKGRRVGRYWRIPKWALDEFFNRPPSATSCSNASDVLHLGGFQPRLVG